MLGSTTSMVFELWLHAKPSEGLECPGFDVVRKNIAAVIKYLHLSQNIHGFAFNEDLDEADEAFRVQYKNGDETNSGLLGSFALQTMRDEACAESYRLDDEGDSIGHAILDVYWHYIMWLYDEWLMKIGALRGDNSLKAIVSYLAERL